MPSKMPAAGLYLGGATGEAVQLPLRLFGGSPHRVVASVLPSRQPHKVLWIRVRAVGALPAGQRG